MTANGECPRKTTSDRSVVIGDGKMSAAVWTDFSCSIGTMRASMVIQRSHKGEVKSLVLCQLSDDGRKVSVVADIGRGCRRNWVSSVAVEGIVLPKMPAQP